MDHPTRQLFHRLHYGIPEVTLDDWQLEITGLVDNPMTLTMADLQTWPRQSLDFTIEVLRQSWVQLELGPAGQCRVGRWRCCRCCKKLASKMTLSKWRFMEPMSARRRCVGSEIDQNFARSMSFEEVTSPFNMLCYEMNGEPLPVRHGFPLRLIAPGWYGVANLKWLQKIEVRSRRLMNRFMARDYVTLRKGPSTVKKSGAKVPSGAAYLNQRRPG
ncbi:MAG: molybdopterin-dependent oxidoreductase [Caldilineaceae bacterium]